MKIIVAPDSFKGTLSAPAAAAAMAAGARRARPDAEVVLIPLADGGEGTAEALTTATGGRLVSRRVTGPLGGTVEASFGLLGTDGQAAVVEMAQAAGLGLVPPDRRDPRVTTTYGVGELLRAATEAGAREIIVGLGGSATNDGGAGAMQALGVRFLDAAGQPLASGGAALARLARIETSSFDFSLDRVTVTAASDVRNPLVGPDGASAVYGPQKGADAATVAELDAALSHYAEILRRDVGRDVAHLPGAGAAGGLGAALAAFLNATFRNGIDVVLVASDFDARARDADWVLTGEGRIDGQTLAGKAIAGVLARCRKLGVHVIAFGGVVEDGAAARLRAQGLWDAVPLVSGPVTQEEAMREPARVLEEAVARVIGGLERPPPAR
ncbi:MAG: glycerate kinase [Armatimonadetes bacterium]|nr:glycerate kinase [Armatimonadota bacterium]